MDIERKAVSSLCGCFNLKKKGKSRKKRHKEIAGRKKRERKEINEIFGKTEKNCEKEAMKKSEKRYFLNCTNCVIWSG